MVNAEAVAKTFEFRNSVGATQVHRNYYPYLPTEFDGTPRCAFQQSPTPFALSGDQYSIPSDFISDRAQALNLSTARSPQAEREQFERSIALALIAGVRAAPLPDDE